MVRRCNQLITGSLVRKANVNPILDGCTYEVEFPDGQTEELAVIAQSMFALCNIEGNQCLLLAGIVDHRKDESAIERMDLHMQRRFNRQVQEKAQRDASCALTGEMGAL
jgi:hypothetical protein